MFLLCIPAAVVQAGEEYQILGASYGTDAHNMEVTDQLKNLASQDRTVKLLTPYSATTQTQAAQKLRILPAAPMARCAPLNTKRATT